MILKRLLNLLLATDRDHRARVRFARLDARLKRDMGLPGDALPDWPAPLHWKMPPDRPATCGMAERNA